MAVVAERIVDGGILHLINLWLKAPVIGEDEGGTASRWAGEKPIGVARCRAASFHRCWRTATCIFLIGYGTGSNWEEAASAPCPLCGRFCGVMQGQSRWAAGKVRHVLERLDLTLNEARTHMVDARKRAAISWVLQSG